MQVQNGVEGFLEESRLVTPLPADKVAWLTVGSRVVYVISGAQARRGSDTHQSRLQASALFTLPVISIYKALSATIRSVHTRSFLFRDTSVVWLSSSSY